jgi:hypothetical protein
VILYRDGSRDRRRVTSEPSDQARDLVRGAFDVHVHVAPDVIERRVGDVELARRFAELGLAGFVLKSHYTSTAERAAVVRQVVPGVNVLGAITLNRSVGGMNALAVEIAAREGARIVWMPTVDAANETMGREAPAPGAKLPVWAQLQRELHGRGIEIEPADVVDGGGGVLPETRATLRTIAEHGLVLATGHLGRDEIFAVVEAAIEEGVREIVVTHPEFPSQDLSVDDQLELAGRGALLERCFTTPHTGKVPWERWLSNTRAAGPEHSVLSTDLGQVSNPPVEDGLALLADRLLAAGFTPAEVRLMAVTNSRRVAGAPAE